MVELIIDHNVAVAFSWWQFTGTEEEVVLISPLRRSASWSAYLMGSGERCHWMGAPWRRRYYVVVTEVGASPRSGCRGLSSRRFELVELNEWLNRQLSHSATNPKLLTRSR